MNNKNVEQLRVELNEWVNISRQFGVNEAEISLQSKTQLQSLRLIKRGKRLTVDNDRNRLKIKNLIALYKKAITEKKRILKNII